MKDAANLIRNDRYLTDELNPKRLTKFGYTLCTNPGILGIPAYPSLPASKQQINLMGFRYKGSIMSHLLTLLPHQFDPDEVCVKDPFHVLSEQEMK